MIKIDRKQSQKILKASYFVQKVVCNFIEFDTTFFTEKVINGLFFRQCSTYLSNIFS